MIVVASCGHNSDDERILEKEIFSLKKEYLVNYFTYNGSSTIIKALNINHHHYNASSYSINQYKKNLIDFILQTKPKIIHIHDMELLPIAKKIKQKKKNIKIIYDVHEDLPSMWELFSSYKGIIKRIVNYLLSTYESLYLKYIDLFIIANQFADHDRYRCWGKVELIYNYPLTSHIIKQVRQSESPYKIIYHGQLDESRGILKLIDAFNLISKKNKKIELTIIGQARKKDFYKDLKNKTSQNININLMDPVPHEQIWEILYESHIGVIPFNDHHMYHKNTPTKLFEFMASNCAIVSSDVKPVTNITSKNIYLTRNFDVESLKSGIEFYINNNIEYHEHIKKNRIKINEKLNWNIMEKKLMHIYKKMI